MCKSQKAEPDDTAWPGASEPISQTPGSDETVTVLRGLGLWTPQYPSAAVLCAAAFADEGMAATPVEAQLSDDDPANVWPQMVNAIAGGVRGWEVEHANWPLLFATTKGDVRRTIRMVDQPDFLLPRLWDDAAAMAAACGFAAEVVCISTACASSLAALCEAHLRLMMDPSISRVAVITADTASDFVCDGFKSLRATAEAGVRPFDSGRQGLRPGSAAAWCFLEKVIAQPGDMRLLGWGLTNDAAHLTAPDAQGCGLRAAIVDALQSANRAPADVDAIIAHGTGTAFSDAMEARVFAQLFPHSPPLTAIKGLLGHTLGASGLAELAVAHAMLQRQQIPPIIGLRQSDYPGINPVSGRPLRPSHAIRTILKTASGFGGVNAAMLVGDGRA